MEGKTLPQYTPVHHIRFELRKHNLCQKDIDIIAEDFAKNMDSYRRGPDPPLNKLFIPFREIIVNIADKKGIRLKNDPVANVK